MIDSLVSELDRSVSAFLKSLPAEEKKIYSKILKEIRELSTYKDGTIKNNLENIKKLARIKRQLNDTILTKTYLVTVNEFIDTYNTVEKIQNIYFAKLSADFTPTAVLAEVKKQAITDTVELLTENGVAQALSNNISAILNVNVKSGGSFAQLTEQLRQAIIGDKELDGGLTRYAGQIVTDSINGYSATYTQIITEDLGLKWMRFVGSLIRTSRPMCVAMVAKSYIHKSEFPTLIKGYVDGKKVSTAGMNKNTTVSNYQILRNGFNCAHQFIPISEVSVPKSVRTKVYDEQGIKYDAEGMAV